MQNQKFPPGNPIGIPPQNVPSQLIRNVQWKKLKESIGDFRARNLWLFAHGSPSSVGGDYEVFPSGGGYYPQRSRARLEATDVASMLDNGADVVTNPDGTKRSVQRIKRPYRFVFMDGCSTGKAPIWPAVFGLDTIYHNDPSPYQQDGRYVKRPSAFIGWREDVPASKGLEGLGKIDEGAEKFRSRLIYHWKDRGLSLDQAIDEAFEEASGTWGKYFGLGGWAATARRLLVQTGLGSLHFHEGNQDDLNQNEPPP